MTLAELKALLASGAITQEQFDAMVKQLGLEEELNKENPDDKGAEDKGNEGSGVSKEELQKLIQQSVDRATNKLGNENKQLREELEKIRKEKLTAEELKQLEDEEREKNLAEREALLKAAENKMYAVKAIKKAGLDDGSETALDILALVNGKDEATIDGNIKALKALVDKLVKAEVDKTFKDSGRNPQQGNGGAGGGDNPYAAGTFNLTKQCELEATNPELAAKLKAAAGVSK